MKLKSFFILAAIAGIMLVGCKNGSSLKYSFQVIKEVVATAPAKAPIADNDEVELYVKTFAYIHETSPKWIIVVASVQNDMHDKLGNQIINDGWFNANTSEWINQADQTQGNYPAIMLKFTKLRVNGTVYTFPGDDYSTVIFGDVDRPEVGEARNYIDRFPGFYMPSKHSGLKTILTVERDIIGEPNTEGYDAQGLANDPYKFITIQAIVEP